MGIKDFFVNLGKGFMKVSTYILKRVSDNHIDIAVDIVKVAANKFIDNNERREWAVGRIQTELKLPESLARWLVETAVLQVKSETEALIDKAADKAKEHNID